MSNNFLNALLQDDFYYHPISQVKFGDYHLYNDVLTLTDPDDFCLEIKKLSKTFFRIRTGEKIKSEKFGSDLRDFLILHRECNVYYTEYNEGHAAIVVASRKKNIFEFSKTVVFYFYDTCVNCNEIVTYLSINEL